MLSALFGKAVGSACRLGKTFTPAIDTPKGIASLEQVELGGCRQWILIRGQDSTKPLLLFVHGGPGSSEMWFAHHSMRELEKHFVCVNWDQRGAGKSFGAGMPAGTMNLGQFVADAVSLIELLLKRFGQQKLLLVGHSWGSVIAMKVAESRPDLLHALVGMGQVVDMMRGEQLSYDYTLERARRAGNAKAVRQLEKIGPPPYKGNGLWLQRRWLSEYKGDTWSLDMKGVLAIGLRATEYSFADFVRFIKGVRFSNKLLWSELCEVNFPRDLQSLAIPVFFFAGRHDYTTPFALVQEFFQTLKAPSKRLVWFEDSAHMANLEEPAKFQAELVRIGEEIGL
jgi:pimeloyl-ACP methyl ester carboxylesterase